MSLTFSEQWTDVNGNPAGGITMAKGFCISWQNGPLGLGKGKGRREPNGAFVEDVILAAKDRLEFYQNSQFWCQENERAIIQLDYALRILNERTSRRESKGIEGTNIVDQSAEGKP